MNLSSLLKLRPTHIEQKLNDTWISLLPLSTISKLQNFRIPILKSNEIEELKGWFFASKMSSTITGISFDVSKDESIFGIEIILKKLIVYLTKSNIDNPFFIEAEIDLEKLDKNPETIFYHLLQSYFTTFNIKISILNLKNEVEKLNSIYKPIRDLELGFTLTINSSSRDILNNLDELIKVLSIFKIKPNFIMIKDNDLEAKKLISEKLNIGFSEEITLFNDFSDNIYIESKQLRTNVKETIESQVFYSSRKLFDGLGLNKTLPKLLSNLYRFGDEL